MQRELIVLVLNHLSSILGLEIKYLKSGSRDEEDGAVEINYQGCVARFRIESRKQITTTVVKMMIAGRAPEQFHNLLLVAPHITPACAKLLKARDVCYADATGNLFLHAGPLYLNVIGEKVRKGGIRDGLMPIRQSFAANALKLIFAILTDPALDREPARALLNQNYRTMGSITGMPLGSIASTMSALQAGGYVVTEEKGEKLLFERKKLMTRWIEDYAARLRPRLVWDHYRIPKSRWWVDVNVREANGLWGCEIAGAKLTDYLSPETATIYSDAFPDEFILTQTLYKDPAGQVEVLRPFWGPIPWAKHEDCVHPLLVYADLMASDIDRNMDTAQRIYDRYLRQIIEPA